MRNYLVVETRDAADHRDAARTLDLACGLARQGNGATVLMTDNAAFNARGAAAYPIDKALEAGVEIRVDTFAMKERGIGEDELAKGVTVGSMDDVVDHLINGSCVMWR